MSAKGLMWAAAIAGAASSSVAIWTLAATVATPDWVPNVPTVSALFVLAVVGIGGATLSFSAFLRLRHGWATNRSEES